MFFSGCNLRCVFCQNHEISRKAVGKTVTVPELRDIFRRLEDTGVHNINLVTPTHYSLPIAEALSGISLSVPVVWNSSGYDSVETLRQLEGLVQIYMPDYKYAKSELARKYSAAPDYPEIARAALLEMYRQTGPFVLDEEGIMKSGLIVRHLVLPYEELNTMDVVDFIAEEFPPSTVMFSLMGQYTPMPGLDRFPELQSTVDPGMYDLLCDYVAGMGIETGYIQELDSATEEMIPEFDLTGI